MSVPSPPPREPLFAELCAERRAALYFTLAPATILALTLKGLTLMLRDPPSAGWHQLLDLISGEALFALALSALALWALGVTPRWRPLVLILVQGVTLSWLLLELIAFRFYLTTQSTLDWQLIAIYISQIDHLWEMVDLARSPEVRVVIFAIAALLLISPWLYLWRQRRRQSAARSERVALWRRFLIAALAASALCLLFPLCSPQQRLGRATPVEIVWRAAERSMALDDARGAPRADLKRALTPREGAEARSILLILLESTGARVTSPYDPQRGQVTPALGQLAEQGLVLEHAFSVVPHTSKALFAIHCAMPPAPLAALVEAGSQGSPTPCLPELLADQGYQTAFMQGASLFFEHRNALLPILGYQTRLGAEDITPRPAHKINYLGYGEHHLIEPARRFIRARDTNRPFMLTLLTLAAHHDYKLPEGYVLKRYHDDETINRYLNCVAYSDAFLAGVLKMMREEGALKDTIVAVIGDHGEAFGEHGRNFHDNVIYQEALAVPFVLSGPGVPRGARLKAPVTQLDVMPTLAALAGFDLIGPSWGVALLDERAISERDGALVLSCWYERACAALIDWPYKYIHHFGQREDELYDLERDPREQRDLMSLVPEASALKPRWDAKAMRRELLKALDERLALHAH